MAFAIRRRTGTAVARNRLRRRLRAIAAGTTPLPPGAYLVRPADRAAGMPFDQLAAAFGAAVARATRAA